MAAGTCAGIQKAGFIQNFGVKFEFYSKMRLDSWKYEFTTLLHSPLQPEAQNRNIKKPAAQNEKSSQKYIHLKHRTKYKESARVASNTFQIFPLFLNSCFILNKFYGWVQRGACPRQLQIFLQKLHKLNLLWLWTVFALKLGSSIFLAAYCQLKY